MPDLTGVADTMKVKPVRMPVAMIEQGTQRAAAEGLRGGFSELVRIGIARVLADPAPLGPPPEPAVHKVHTPEEPAAEVPGCLHPKASRKYLGYVTICGDCRVPLNRGR